VDAERTTSSTARYIITPQETSRAVAFIHSFRSESRMQYATRDDHHHVVNGTNPFMKKNEMTTTWFSLW
jgi:hypothetical protein